MKAKVLSAILTCAHLLIVNGIDFEDPDSDGADHSKLRVLNGIPANVFDFPHLVSLFLNGMSCDGSIIADQWIVTAGHCLYEVPCSLVEIHPSVWPYEQIIQPTECHCHPGYSPESHAYDISLMKAPINFRQAELTQVIPLPEPGTWYETGTWAVLAGWGQTEEEKYPSELLWAKFRVEDWDVCNRKFIDSEEMYHPPGYIPQGIPRRVLCTQGVGVTPAGSCFGDSGGPVTIDGILAGIVSFGIAPRHKCVIGTPSMHTNVVDYLPWIYSFLDPEMNTSWMPIQPEY